jgi:hypothetical protein
LIQGHKAPKPVKRGLPVVRPADGRIGCARRQDFGLSKGRFYAVAWCSHSNIIKPPGMANYGVIEQ